MSDRLSSLTPYPSNGREELPPALRDWRSLIWATLAAGVVVLLLCLAHVFGPAVWLIAIIPGFDTVVVFGLAVCGLVALTVFLFAWQRSEARRDE